MKQASVSSAVQGGGKRCTEGIKQLPSERRLSCRMDHRPRQRRRRPLYGTSEESLASTASWPHPVCGVVKGANWFTVCAADEGRRGRRQRGRSRAAMWLPRICRARGIPTFGARLFVWFVVALFVFGIIIVVGVSRGSVLPTMDTKLRSTNQLGMF